MLGNLSRLCCCLLAFFKINFLKKNISGTLSECQTVWIQIRTDRMSVLIWVLTVYIGYHRLSADDKSQCQLLYWPNLTQNLITLKVPPIIKTCVKRPLSKRPKTDFQDQLSLYAGQKYCRTLQMEHSAILLAFMKLPNVNKIFVLSIFEWSFYTHFTVAVENI